MTKSETISNLKAYLDGDTAIGNIIPLRSVLESAIKYLEPSLPSNLDEAAHKYADGENPTCLCGECLIKTFKAGVQWHDAQILKLPNNIDEAAKEIVRDWLAYGNGEYKKLVIIGAEWMAGQGVNADFEVCKLANRAWLTPIDEKRFIQDVFGNFEAGDKVVVQIRKK